MPSRGDDPQYKLRKERERIRNSNHSKEDREEMLRFLSAFDNDDPTESYTDENGNTETLSYNSLENYGRAMRLIASESDRPLLDHTLNSLGAIFNDFLDELSIQTVRQRQAAAIKFYRFHETGIDPDEIPLTQREEDTSVDERDMLTREEIQRIRDACTNARDRCLLELLVYTGQRIRAIQTLRIKDIDLENNIYYLNTDELGLKSADKVGRKRPLLGATNAVRDWIDKHPTGDRDDYLITPLSSASGKAGDGEYLSLPAIRRQLNRLGERAEIEKPVNPHNFRHFFVTVCIREYEMDPSTVKHLIGHRENSTVMETTYQHLTDDDHINAARAATDAGEDPEQSDSPLTPQTCPVCGEPQGPTAKACPNCGEVFTPDAKSAQETVEDVVHEGAMAAETDAEREAIDSIREYVKENPELIADHPELVERVLSDQ